MKILIFMLFITDIQLILEIAIDKIISEKWLFIYKFILYNPSCFFTSKMILYIFNHYLYHTETLIYLIIRIISD